MNPTTQDPRPLRLTPYTDAGMIEVIARHGLTEVPVPVVDLTDDAEGQTVARWLAHLASPNGGGYKVRLMFDMTGAVWLFLRDGVGLITGGNVDATVRRMRRDVVAGRSFEADPAGRRRAGLKDFLKGEARRLATPEPQKQE